MSDVSQNAFVRSISPENGTFFLYRFSKKNASTREIVSFDLKGIINPLSRIRPPTLKANLATFENFTGRKRLSNALSFLCELDLASA